MPKTILVVDDDRLMVQLAGRKLQEKGYDVLTASNGEEALAQLKIKIPAMILLDVQMPDMNGYTFIIERNKTPEFANIPVVMLTASSETGPLFKRHGVKGYLLKPLNLQALFDKVTEIVGAP